MVRESGHPTIAINRSFRIAPWADILFAMDAYFWQEHIAEVERTFKGERWGFVRTSAAYKVIATKGELYPTGWGHSGSYAMSLGVVGKPMKIIGLGYDCQFGPNGEKHWHEDYPEKMGNASSIRRWPYHYELISKYAASHGVKVVNCSRATALTCFERGDLERELA